MSPGPAYLLNPCFAMRLSRCLGAGAPGAGCWIFWNLEFSEALILYRISLERR